jgi:hypothetical protein
MLHRPSQHTANILPSFQTRSELQFEIPHWQPTLPGELVKDALPAPHLSIPPAPYGEIVQHALSQDPPHLLDISAHGEADVLHTRPNEGGKADVVQFGLYAKAFYGLDMLAHSFTLDGIVSLQWTDPRVAELLQEGQQSMTLSSKEASKKLWLPDVAITNRDIRRIEIISSSVEIGSGGSVTKLERSLVVIKNKFDLTAFPFDDQNLTVNIASSKLGLADVKLAPMVGSEASGITDDLFDGEGFTFVSFQTTEFEDVTGMLRKSRGQMRIAIHRTIDKYMQSHLIPSVIHLVISWGVFWFPFVMQFITPRLALSILALLSFTNLSLNIDKQLPPGAPFTWNDLYNQNCQLVLASTVVLNIWTEIVAHQLKLPDLGQRFNHECKVVWPLVASVALTPICRFSDPKHLMATHTLSHKILLVILSTYFTACVARICRAEVRAKT